MKHFFILRSLGAIRAMMTSKVTCNMSDTEYVSCSLKFLKTSHILNAIPTNCIKDDPTYHRPTGHLFIILH